MEPKKITTRSAFTIVGMAIRTRNEQNEIPEMWGAFDPRVGEIKNIVDPHVAYGISANMDEATGEFDYLAGFAVSDASDVPEGMVRWDVPEGTYAVFTCTLPTLGETFRQVYHTWLPQSGYGPGHGMDIELYGEGFDPQDPASEMAVYIPIQET
jgi:AraC family transcriptional regulator